MARYSAKGTTQISCSKIPPKIQAPRDKLVCLVNVKTTAESLVQVAAAAGARIGGADAFFPVLLLIVIQARPQRLASTIEYIKRFRGSSRLRGQFDYMLANLVCACLRTWVGFMY